MDRYTHYEQVVVLSECLDGKDAIMLLSNDVTLADFAPGAFGVGTDYSNTLSALLVSL